MSDGALDMCGMRFYSIRITTGKLFDRIRKLRVGFEQGQGDELRGVKACLIRFWIGLGNNHPFPIALAILPTLSSGFWSGLGSNQSAECETLLVLIGFLGCTRQTSLELNFDGNGWTP